MTVMAVRGDGTVRAGLDGTGYEIARTAGHARALRDSLARCVAAAQQAGGGRRPAGRRASVSGLNHCGRGVGQGAGIEVKDCARVSAGLVARFQGGHRQIDSEVTAARVTALSLTCMLCRNECVIHVHIYAHNGILTHALDIADDRRAAFSNVLVGKSDRSPTRCVVRVGSTA